MLRRNLEMVKIVAEALGDLKEQVVFVGGSILELYADHVVPEEVRPTEDVDMVVNIATRTALACSMPPNAEKDRTVTVEKLMLKIAPLASS
ncbi:MAG TPA: hypothetical protein DCG57_13015 [Candidatus Riflebacteria bacterium]|jgi:hypothetical protein|nr:hypothetical protein [Candidatus Riflebacteria bacterium]